MLVIEGIQEMIDILGKIIPQELNIGDEYTKKDLAEIFKTSDVENIIGGIGLVKNCMLLLITLDKTFFAELPNDLDKMNREEFEEHSYRHLDYFDINEKVFGWDGPTTMNIESPLINSFIANVYPCLLFARKYYFKNETDYKKNITNNKYVYCGRIRYIEHYNTTPPHFISSIEEIINEPNEKLSQLYKFKPQKLDEKLKEFGHLEEKESNDFIDLTKREESRTHERKATFAGPKHKHDIDMTQKCVKAIAGFLNERGGNLMIGIQDCGDVTGIERDFMFKDQDKFNLYILSQLEHYLDEYENIQSYINIRFQNGGDKNKLVCQINCKPLPNKIVAFVQGKLCQRRGPQTVWLNAKQSLNYIEERKKR